MMRKLQIRDSFVLQNVTINTKIDQVDVTCHFRNDSAPSSQCVIVIRKSTEAILMVETYTVSMTFPVVLNISEPGNYSVAVFGWSDDMIEPFPAELQQVAIAGISQGHQYYMCWSIYEVYIGSRKLVCSKYFMFGCRYINTRVAHNSIFQQ